MLDLLKIFVSFILSGVVGVSVSHYFQRKSLINQFLLKKSEEKVSELKDIRDSFEQLSAERIYRAKYLINEMLSKGAIDESMADARKNYQDSVGAWNKKLNIFFLDLGVQGLNSIARNIESGAHASFREAHDIMNEQINRKLKGVDKSKLKLALDKIDSAYSNSIEITKELTRIADIRWDEVRFTGTERLTLLNLEHASTFKLIIATFHKVPLSLRISCPNSDSFLPCSVRN